MDDDGLAELERKRREIQLQLLQLAQEDDEEAQADSAPPAKKTRRDGLQSISSDEEEEEEDRDMKPDITHFIKPVEPMKCPYSSRNAADIDDVRSFTRTKITKKSDPFNGHEKTTPVVSSAKSVTSQSQSHSTKEPEPAIQAVFVKPEPVDTPSNSPPIMLPIPENDTTNSNSLESSAENSNENSNDVPLSSNTFVPEKEPTNGNSENAAPVEMEKIWKTVLEKIENDHFDGLPPDWCRITHLCGMHVYLHKPSRVVTMTRPYYIGTSSVRRHKIPLTAVPCLHQKRINEKLAEKEAAVEAAALRGYANQQGSDIANVEIDRMLAAQNNDVSIERSNEYQLSAEELTDYASAVWKFKKIQVTRYRSMAEKKQIKRDAYEATKGSDDEEDMDNGNEEVSVSSSAPTKGITLLKIPTADPRFNRKDFVMNPAGKKSVIILHEYSQRVLHSKLIYDIDDTRNQAAPFSVTALVIINKKTLSELAPTIREKLNVLQKKLILARPMKELKKDEDVIVIGREDAPSKKVGKMLASIQALKVLIPNLRFDDSHVASIINEVTDTKAYEIFDNLKIDDPRVTELCIKTGVPKPFMLLTTACNRDIRLDGMQIMQDTKPINHEQEHEVTLTVGAYECTMRARGIKNAKQLAAQGILKAMNEDLTNYGSVLRLYADSDEGKEARKNQEQIVRMQNQGSRIEPNMAVLSKLKSEMARIQRDPEVPARGTILRKFHLDDPQHAVSTPALALSVNGIIPPSQGPVPAPVTISPGSLSPTNTNGCIALQLQIAPPNNSHHVNHFHSPNGHQRRHSRFSNARANNSHHSGEQNHWRPPGENHQNNEHTTNGHRHRSSNHPNRSRSPARRGDREHHHPHQSPQDQCSPSSRGNYPNRMMKRPHFDSRRQPHDSTPLPLIPFPLNNRLP